MKRNKSIFLMLAFLAAATSSYGTIYFQNLGNTSAYNFSNSMDSVEGVSSPSYIGSDGAIAATCTYQGSGVRYHSEWTPVGTWNQGTSPTAYFGYAIYLPTSFQFTGTQRAVTEQYGTRLAGGGTINPDWYQAWIGGGNASEYQFGGGGISDQNSGTMTVGAWHTVVTKITYGSGGSITVWFDGNQAWSLNNITVNGGGSGNTNGLWALGLYEADWDGGNTGNGTDITVYGAGATIATTYNEANPLTYANALAFSGEYQIQCVASSLSLSVSNNATADGAPIIQLPFGGSGNELWTLIPISNGYYQIQNMHSGLDLVVQSASTANGAPIIQWSFGSSGDDQWKPVPNSDGTYTFYNLHSGLVLDDPGLSTSSGTQFDQWPANGGLNQEFNIIAGPSLIWNGNVNGNWDTTTANWQGGLTYQQGDGVIFNNTAAGATNVNLTTTLSPNSITVSNANYIFSGSGSLSGSASLIKKGSGTLTLMESGGDSFSGGIAVSNGTVVLDNIGSAITGGTIIAGGGTIQVGNNDANGLLPSGAVTDNGALAFNQTANVSVGNAVSGTGAVTNASSGTITMNVANSYSGGLTIVQGAIQGNNANSFGANANVVTVDSGGQAYNNGAVNVANPFVIAGSGPDGNGAIRMLQSGSETWSGSITMNGNALIADSCTSSSFPEPTITGTIGGTGNLELGNYAATHGCGINLNPSSANNWNGNLLITCTNANYFGLYCGAIGGAGSQNCIPNTANVTIQSLGAGGAELVLQNASLTIAGLNSAVNPGCEVGNEKTGTGTLTVGNNNASGNFGGSIINGSKTGNILNLVKTGTGTQILGGVNTYTGTTTISNGTLTVNGSLPSGGTVTVANTGTLSGTGTIGGTVTVNGTIAPGLPSVIGMLTCSSTVALDGTNTMRLNKTNQTNDVLSVGGNLIYGGTLNLTNLSGVLTATDTFKLFKATTSIGAFTRILPAVPGTNLLWNTNSLTNGVLGIVSMTVPQPQITSIALSGTNLILTGTNATPGKQFVLLGSTNAALPLDQWTSLLTNIFGDENFAVTNAINPYASQSFYLLRLQ